MLCTIGTPGVPRPADTLRVRPTRGSGVAR